LKRCSALCTTIVLTATKLHATKLHDGRAVEHKETRKGITGLTIKG